MYKLSYYRYAEASLMTTGQLGFDRVRNVQIGKMDISLEYFEEVHCQETPLSGKTFCRQAMLTVELQTAPRVNPHIGKFQQKFCLQVFTSEHWMVRIYKVLDRWEALLLLLAMQSQCNCLSRELYLTKGWTLADSSYSCSCRPARDGKLPNPRSSRGKTRRGSS